MPRPFVHVVASPVPRVKSFLDYISRGLVWRGEALHKQRQPLKHSFTWHGPIGRYEPSWCILFTCSTQMLVWNGMSGRHLAHCTMSFVPWMTCYGTGTWPFLWLFCAIHVAMSANDMPFRKVINVQRDVKMFVVPFFVPALSWHKWCDTRPIMTVIQEYVVPIQGYHPRPPKLSKQYSNKES